MVLDGNGQISGLIELRDNAAKKCSGRSLPRSRIRGGARLKAMLS
jgi:hypothetical protein